ncbi:MAG: hypothetical protein ACN2B6_00235 [Rickettsiales bacterium]
MKRFIIAIALALAIRLVGIRAVCVGSLCGTVMNIHHTKEPASTGKSRAIDDLQQKAVMPVTETPLTKWGSLGSTER